MYTYDILYRPNIYSYTTYMYTSNEGRPTYTPQHYGGLHIKVHCAMHPVEENYSRLPEPVFLLRPMCILCIM